MYASNLITGDTPFGIMWLFWQSAYGYFVILLNYGPLVEKVKFSSMTRDNLFL